VDFSENTISTYLASIALFSSVLHFDPSDTQSSFTQTKTV